jgi:hypothetical protein
MSSTSRSLSGNCCLGSSVLDGLAPWLAPYAKYLVSYFPELQVTSAYRSYSDQLRLWNNRHNNPYPVAYPGTSFHELGRAWDMVGPPELLALAGHYWNSWGGTWSARDQIHFQA